jgi:hypothetical protein
MSTGVVDFKSVAPIDLKYFQVVRQLATSALESWKLAAVFYNEQPAREK